jgi:hypothetical protein
VIAAAGPILHETLGAALSGALFCLRLAAIVVPALILYEVLAPLPVFARWGRGLGPRLARLGMSPPCTLPLVAGLFLGIAYGAGIIIPIGEERRIGPLEIQSVGLFLCTCHAVIEDTLLFALIGSRGAWEVGLRMAVLVGVRLALAIAVTAARARILGAGRGAAGGGGAESGGAGRGGA